jgi:hypothetical protein
MIEQFLLSSISQSPVSPDYAMLSNHYFATTRRRKKPRGLTMRSTLLRRERRDEPGAGAPFSKGEGVNNTLA